MRLQLPHPKGAVMTPADLKPLLLALKANTERALKMLDGALAALEAGEVEHAIDAPQPQGCQHVNTRDVSTMNRRAALCLDCQQELDQPTA